MLAKFLFLNAFLLLLVDLLITGILFNSFTILVINILG